MATITVTHAAMPLTPLAHTIQCQCGCSTPRTRAGFSKLEDHLAAYNIRLGQVERLRLVIGIAEQAYDDAEHSWGWSGGDVDPPDFTDVLVERLMEFDLVLSD